jgi:nickel-dependent lactate racemase
MKTLKVPARRWYENEERTLTFPDRWEVDNLTSPGFEKQALTARQIREKLEHPVAGPSLSELAEGKKKAVIVFDDMTRPTPVRDVATPVLDILHEAGMRRDQIRFLWALGSHGAYDMIAARKKLGEGSTTTTPFRTP